MCETPRWQCVDTASDTLGHVLANSVSWGLLALHVDKCGLVHSPVGRPATSTLAVAQHMACTQRSESTLLQSIRCISQRAKGLVLSAVGSTKLC